MYSCSLTILLALAGADAARVLVSRSSEAELEVQSDHASLSRGSHVSGARSSAEIGEADRVDVTDLIAGADAVGTARCCCDIETSWLFRSNRTGLCVLVRGIKKCGGLPKTSWAVGGLHHYTQGRGVCVVSAELAKKVRHEYGSPDTAEPVWKYLYKVGPGFWNIRAPLTMHGLEVGTHMSLAQLADGNFVAIDTVDLSPPGLKEEIDLLTHSGSKLIAVLGTHPFHTLFFPGFNEAYPSGSKRQYFGAPRHLRMFPDINWAGPITDAFGKWSELDMLIPEGGEFDDPKPPDYNHLMNVIVFHKPGRTVHNDDCIMVVQSERMSFGANVASWFLEWMRPGMHFHPSLTGPGLYQSSDAPAKFKESIERVLAWDFDNLCSAHNGNSIGDARNQLKQLLADTEPIFQKLATERANSRNQGKWSDKSGGDCG